MKMLPRLVFYSCLGDLKISLVHEKRSKIKDTRLVCPALLIEV